MGKMERADAVGKYARSAQAIVVICHGKDPLSWAQARHILDRVTHKRKSITAYHCPVCRAWHVGNAPKRRQKQWREA